VHGAAHGKGRPQGARAAALIAQAPHDEQAAGIGPGSVCGGGQAGGAARRLDAAQQIQGAAGQRRGRHEVGCEHLDD
jgi:hypothetical protein